MELKQSVLMQQSENVHEGSVRLEKSRNVRLYSSLDSPIEIANNDDET